MKPASTKDIVVYGQEKKTFCIRDEPVGQKTSGMWSRDKMRNY